MNRDIYALGDTEQLRSKGGGAFKLDYYDAIQKNKEGYGIFWTVNDLVGGRRADCLRRINSWAIDIDGGNKLAHMTKLSKYLRPSEIIETKNGFHVYWHAKDATLENYEKIVMDRLIYIFDGDEKAKDVARLLRVPGFLHQKDPNNPFEIKSIWRCTVSYTEAQMFYNFKLPKAQAVTSEAKQELRNMFRGDSNDFWEKVYNMDCEQALIRISGTSAMGCEKVEFRRAGRENKNIVIDGKGTSCWIDKDGRIGSLSKGGPTIAQWINWYHMDYKKTYQLIKEHFPELWTK